MCYVIICPKETHRQLRCILSTMLFLLESPPSRSVMGEKAKRKGIHYPP